ncbi:uncharacterized protein [Amphiura filiformis]|uniref:uncharacterized protein isoform X2 n=1 Tax=Amphiura filiformis TaxID=82378 RepID=UPI003B222357
MWMSDDQEDTEKMSATMGRAGIEENRQDYPRPMTTKGRPMTTRGRPVTTKGRPMTTRGRRIQHGSVESLESRTSSEQTGEESKDITRSNNDNKEDRRLLNRSRAHTAPPSKYHSSCSLSSASSDSLNGSNNSGTRCKSMQVYPSPDNICRVSNKKPGYYEFLRPYSAYTKPLWKEPKLPLAFQDSKKLNHSSLTDGERFYLWRTASVYGMTDMKKQNQKRYEKILRHTVETGFHTEEEIQKYMNYFKGSRKRQFHTDPSVWREPPRIPVRQLRFRPPPTSPRGWNSYLPQGNLGRGRGQSTNSMSPGDEKSGSTEKSERQERKKRAPGVSLEEEEPEKDERDKVKHGNNDKKMTEDNHTENSPASKHDSDEREHDDEQDDDEQEQPPVQIYYDMKLKRTVIKPGAPDSKRDENEKNSSNNKRMKPKDNKVSFNLNYKSKEQNKLKGQDKSQDKGKSKGNLKSPRQKQTDKQSPRPPPPRRSWEKIIRTLVHGPRQVGGNLTEFKSKSNWRKTYRQMMMKMPVMVVDNHQLLHQVEVAVVEQVGVVPALDLVVAHQLVGQAAVDRVVEVAVAAVVEAIVLLAEVRVLLAEVRVLLAEVRVLLAEVAVVETAVEVA